MCDMVGSEGRKKKGTRALRCAGGGMWRGLGGDFG